MTLASTSPVRISLGVIARIAELLRAVYYGEHASAVSFGFPLADTWDLQQRGSRVRFGAGNGLQRLIVKNEKRRHAFFLGKFSA